MNQSAFTFKTSQSKWIRPTPTGEVEVCNILLPLIITYYFELSCPICRFILFSSMDESRPNPRSYSLQASTPPCQSDTEDTESK